MRSALLCVAVLWAASSAAAQDAVTAAPGHHKVVFENDQVRVLRVSIGPGEKTASHQHPAGVVVFLSDYTARVTPAGGKADETPRKAGEVLELKPVTHVVENTGSTKAEVIVVELKGKPAAAK